VQHGEVSQQLQQFLEQEGHEKESSLVITTLCLKTELQALVGVLLHHPQRCWVPWSASRGARGASGKMFWCLRQANGEFSALIRSALPGPREAVETPSLEVFRTQ